MDYRNEDVDMDFKTKDNDDGDFDWGFYGICPLDREEQVFCEISGDVKRFFKPMERLSMGE